MEGNKSFKLTPDSVEGTRGLRLTHNGMDVQFIKTMEQAEDYIKKVLSKHANLRPRLRYDNYLVSKSYLTREKKKVRVVLYQYTTLFQEIFVIEEV